jgi:hypothetical protein
MLYFTDAFLREKKDPVVRPGIGISRVRGTAQEALLFFVETTSPGQPVTFAGSEIRGEILDARSAALLWVGVEQVTAFGNGRSRGRGWLVSPTPETVRVRECWVNSTKWTREQMETAFRSWLTPSKEVMEGTK